MLRGEYVILRSPEMDDADIMTAWLTDREVTRYIPTFPYSLSKKTQEDFIRNTRVDDTDRTFIIETEDEVPIGICSLNNIDWVNSTAEIRVVLYAKNCWGRGYGFDTVKTMTNYGMMQLNIQTLYANLIEENERAIKCFQKAGYEIEGTLRSRLFKDGQFKNMISMSISNMDC